MINKIETFLAVIVLYNRKWIDAPSSSFLLEELRKIHKSNSGECALSLMSLLIYDNSPTTISNNFNFPEGVEYVNNVLNGGTRSAYKYALDLANREGIQWVLLLDQDTCLPNNFFTKVADSINFCLNEGVEVLLPRAIDGDIEISPSYISVFGSIKKISNTAELEFSTFKKYICGIASGSIIKVAALNSLPAMPPILWLDYVDHWIFLSLNKLGVKFSIIDVVLEHQLSILNIRCIDKKRIFSILDGEREFISALGSRAKIIYPFRIIFRYIKFKIAHPEVAKFMSEWIWTKLKNAKDILFTHHN